MSGLNIFQRINAVMKEVTYVQKDKAVSAGAGGNYKAVTHDNLVSVARAAMVRNGIVFYPEQKGGGLLPPSQKADGSFSAMRLYEGSYVFHFVNMDAPAESIPVSVVAHAADSGDKAPGKCLTYATKQAVLKLLWLETGEAEESREDAREALKPKKPKLADDRFGNALDKVESGEFLWEKLAGDYDLSDAQREKLRALVKKMAEQEAAQ
jgi:hypothetical protein